MIELDLQKYWPPCSEPLSPLCKKIVGRRLSTFLRSLLQLLRSDQTNKRLLYLDVNVTVNLLRHMAFTELEQLPLPKHALESHALAVELLLQILSMDAQDHRQRIIELICKWYDDTKGWRDSLETSLCLLVSQLISMLVFVLYSTQVSKTEWTWLALAVQGIANNMPDEARKHIISIILPALHTVWFILLAVHG